MPRLIAAAALFTACSVPATPGIAYPPDLAEDVHAAYERWYTATGLRPSTVVLWGGSNGTCSAERNLLGWYGSGVVGVCDRARLPRNDTFAVRTAVGWTITHEFGHALGGDHHKQIGVLTASIQDANAVSCITPADVAAVCSVRACQWEAPECVILPAL